MKTVVKTEATFDAMESFGAHQPWRRYSAPFTSSLETSSLESIAGELSLPAAVAHFKRSQPGERLWDGALALIFVAACAATGWVGAVLL